VNSSSSQWLFPASPKKKLSNKRPVLLVDVANLAFRSAFSFRGIMIQIDTGMYVSSGVIYGILSTILQLKDKYNPSGICFVYEGNKDNNHRFNDPVYKASRPTTKSVDITTEIQFIKELISLLGVINIIPQNGEADDGIAALTYKLKKYTQVLIYSNDHDMQALLDTNVKIIKPKFEIYTKENFISSYDFHPKYLSLLLAVAGDSSDNIPGIKNIGEKKAKEIFKSLLNNNIKLSPKNIAQAIHDKFVVVRKSYSVVEITDLIKRYYNLTKLNKQCILKVEIKNKDLEILEKFFLLLKMRRFLTELDKIHNVVKDLFLYQPAVLSAIKEI
jgi:DNA polymerase I